MPQGITPSLDDYLRTQCVGGWTVVTFHGEIDIAAVLAVTARLDAVTALPRCRVVLDLNAVDFLDASGLGLLCRARRHTLAHAGQLLLVCNRPHILRLLRLARLNGVFAVLPSLTDAVPNTGPPPLV